MKCLIFFLALSLNSFASIDNGNDVIAEPTSQEVAANHACFQELEVLGCRDPGEDPKNFRSCMKDVIGSLTTNCRKMMKDLYY